MICASTATRSSSWRTARTIPMSTCSSGSARSTPKAAPATSATATGGWAARQEVAQARHASNSTRSPTASSAGSRIRVLIAGGWFPRYARNLGTDEPMLTGRQLKPATHTVHYGRSRLLLPVGPLDLSANGVADAVGDLALARRRRAPARPAARRRAAAPSSCSPRSRACGQLAPARPAGCACTTSTASRASAGSRAGRRAPTRRSRCAGPRSPSRPSGRLTGNRRNDFRRRPDHQPIVGAVGGRGVEQIAMLGSDPLGVAVRDRREQQELARRPRSNRFSPMPPLRSSTRWRPSSSACTAALHSLSAGIVAVCVISSRPAGPHLGPAQRRDGLGRLTARRQRCQQPRRRRRDLGNRLLEGLGVGRDGRVTPLTLRTYWRAAAAISSAVAAGSSPRNSVMFRHIPQR